MLPQELISRIEQAEDVLGCLDKQNGYIEKSEDFFIDGRRIGLSRWGFLTCGGSPIRDIGVDAACLIVPRLGEYIEWQKETIRRKMQQTSVACAEFDNSFGYRVLSDKKGEKFVVLVSPKADLVSVPQAVSEKTYYLPSRARRIWSGIRTFVSLAFYLVLFLYFMVSLVRPF